MLLLPLLPGYSGQGERRRARGQRGLPIHAAADLEARHGIHWEVMGTPESLGRAHAELSLQEVSLWNDQGLYIGGVVVVEAAMGAIRRFKRGS